MATTAPETQTYKNYIGGEWRESVSGETFRVPIRLIPARCSAASNAQLLPI